jgi:hypothetical protein
LGGAEREKYESDMIAEMAVGLAYLLPLTPKERLETALRGIVQRAIALKSDMVTERRYFSFIWYDSGSEVDLESVDARDPESRDFICTFPGIRAERSIWGQKEVIVLVKAAVKLLRMNPT